MNPNVLKHMTIGSMTRGTYDRHAIVPNDMPLRDVTALCRTTRETDLVLSTREGDLAGLVSMPTSTGASTPSCSEASSSRRT
ncbi:MAG: hypothetical protein R3E53_18790 [Myxococcota bacterium]